MFGTSLNLGHFVENFAFFTLSCFPLKSFKDPTATHSFDSMHLDSRSFSQQYTYSLLESNKCSTVTNTVGYIFQTIGLLV